MGVVRKGHRWNSKELRPPRGRTLFGGRRRQKASGIVVLFLFLLFCDTMVHTRLEGYWIGSFVFVATNMRIMCCFGGVIMFKRLCKG